MSDYFFGRFADIVSPITNKQEFEKTTGSGNKIQDKVIVENKRVRELKSNFLKKYIYSALAVLILLLVAIFYFVSR